MSVAPDEKEFVELPNHGDSAFGALLDALVPADEGATGAGEGDPAGSDGGKPAGAAEGAAVGDGAPAGSGPAPDGAAAGAAAGESGEGDPAPASGDTGAATGDPAGAETPAAGGDLPGSWTVEPATVIPALGELSTQLEDNLTKAFQQQSYESAREEYGQYFDALEKHPRLLVGTEVPAIGKEGMERLKDTADAQEWQEAVKSLLVADIRERATTKMEESSDFLQTVHSSIDLFKNNPDLIPGTKGFDRKLADSFAGMMAPYEVRVDGKLQGYSIPVQPIIDNLRKTAAAASPAPPSKTSAAAPPAAARPTPPSPEPPQAGIASKAGRSSEKEDFSTLFGTIGLPNLQI